MNTLRKVTAVLAVVALLLAPGGVRAGGFQAAIYSARAAGMGGVMVALPGDPTMVAANPATLSSLHGTHFSVGSTVTIPDYSFTPLGQAAATKMKSQVLFPPDFSLTHTFPGGVGLGVTAGIPYSIKTDWGEVWAGDRLVTSSELRAVHLTPALSFTPDEHLSVGAGLRVMFFRMDLNRRFPVSTAPPGGDPATIYATGSAPVAHAVQLGLLYHPLDILSVGVVYESRTRIHLKEGTVAYAGLPPGSEALASATRFQADITLPENISAGIRLEPFPSLLLSAEAQLVRWSTFGGLSMAIGSLTPGSTTETWVDQQGWHDSWVGRAGAELRVFDVALRAGFSIDQTPIPDAHLRPSIPDADRTVYTLGLGYEVGEGLQLDFAVQSIRCQERIIGASSVVVHPTGPFNGTYDISSTVVGLNVSYAWK